MSQVMPVGTAPTSLSAKDTKLWEAAKALESTFLSEMLKSAGVGQARDAFGGGIGEDQFGSFLRDEQAKLMTEAGGIGLAQSIFDALKERVDGNV